MVSLPAMVKFAGRNINTFAEILLSVKALVLQDNMIVSY